MDINDAMLIRRCMKSLADSGKTLDELVIEMAHPADRLEVFILLLVVANLVEMQDKKYVLSAAFTDFAEVRFAQVYGGKTVYVRPLKATHSFTSEQATQFLNEVFGGSRGKKGAAK